MNELYPLNDIIKNLNMLHLDDKTGTMYIASEERHSTRFIIDAVPSLKHSLVALDVISKNQTNILTNESPITQSVKASQINQHLQPKRLD